MVYERGRELHASLSHVGLVQLLLVRNDDEAESAPLPYTNRCVIERRPENDYGIPVATEMSEHFRKIPVFASPRADKERVLDHCRHFLSPQVGRYALPPEHSECILYFQFNIVQKSSGRVLCTEPRRLYFAARDDRTRWVHLH